MGQGEEQGGRPSSQDSGYTLTGQFSQQPGQGQLQPVGQTGQHYGGDSFCPSKVFQKQATGQTCHEGQSSFQQAGRGGSEQAGQYQAQGQNEQDSWWMQGEDEQYNKSQVHPGTNRDSQMLRMVTYHDKEVNKLWLTDNNKGRSIIFCFNGCISLCRK